ncbi:uncharacterized protein LOC103579851 isoform X2 [Microplitis demolitor]|nr:uncharacterized protein LOC103579851 isoform X2 [Microplitis demolitor]
MTAVESRILSNHGCKVDNELDSNDKNDDIQIPREFHVQKYDTKDGIVVELCEFLPRRQIGIYYKAGMLVVTQRKMPNEPRSINKNYKEHDLQKRVPDHTMIVLNPSEINPSKPLAIYHGNKYIYVYQGNQPESETNISADDSEEEKDDKFYEPDLYLSIGNDYDICINKTDFKLYKLVQIYYRENKLFISQRNTPNNNNSNDETIAAGLRYVGSDKTKIFLDPKKIDPKKEVCMQHGDNSIYIYQDRKPDLSLRENKPDDIKYLPEGFSPNVGERKPMAEITKIMPEPDEEKSESVIDITFDSGETLSIFPFEFDDKKLLFILFENNMMKVTQIGAPREYYESEENVEELSIITSDENKLIVHPTALFPRAQLKIRHENGKIYLWIGTDELPNVNIDRPDIIQAVERESVIWDLNNYIIIDNIIENGKVFVLLPGIFNESNLVSIALDNSSNLKITQIGTPQETLDRPEKYKNFKIKTSDRNKLLLHPKKVHPYRYIHIKHENGSIYVSCGNPEIPFVNTDVSGIIEIIEPNPIVDTGRWWPGPSNKLPQPEIIKTVLEHRGPMPDHQQPVHNNDSSIPESKLSVPEYTGSEPSYTSSNSYDEKPKPDHKPSKPNASTIQDINKSFDDSLPVVLAPNMFNPNKLVVVSHKKHRINVYQIDRDEDDDEDDNEDNSGYIDLHYQITNKWTASFDPRKINPNKMIVIYYINKTTYVNTAEGVKNYFLV